MLLGAERPVMIVGQGVRYGGAAEELRKLAERLQIPVASSASGLGALDCNHPLALGLVARAGHYQANHATRQADVLLAMGMRFDDRTSSSWISGYSFTIPPTRLIHVDIDPEEIGRNYPVALGLMADVRTFLRQVHAELDRRSDLTSAPMPAGNGWRRSTPIARNGTSSSPQVFPTTPRRSIRSAPHRDRQGAAGERDPGQRYRGAPQLAVELLQAEAAGLTDRLDGLWSHGVWRRRRDGGEVRRPRSSLRSVCGDGAFFMHANVLGTAVDTICPWSGWSGTTTPMPRSAACNAVISKAVSLPPTFTIRSAASATIRISPPWRAPAASKACVSIAPAILAKPSARASPPTSPT